MSKRDFHIDPKDRFQDRIYNRERFHGAWNSDNHISTTKSPRAKGFSCQKKVNFTAKDIDSPTSCRLEAASIPSKRREVTTYANHPKTSEYAFFKKLKEDAGQRCHSHSLQKDACLLKKLESNDCFRERTNDERVSSKCFNRSMHLEKAPTVNSDSFLSPSVGDMKKSDRYPTSSTQKHLQGHGDSFQPQGTQYVHGKTFSRKRQKLRQWVTDASFPDIDKLIGHDIVSMLLSRLFSNSYEESKCNYPKSGKVVTATRHDLLASQELDIQFKEHHQIPKKKLFELESSSYSSDYLSSPMFHRSDERIILNADFPIYHSHKFQPPYSITEPECNFGGTASFSAKSDMTLGFLFDEQDRKFPVSNHFKELGKLGREPNHLILENDFNSSKDEINLPINHNNAELDRGPALLTSLGNFEEQILNNMLGAWRLCSSSILLNQPQDFSSTLDSPLLRYQECRFGKYVYEDMDTDFNRTSFSLSYNKDYLKLSEDCKSDASCVPDSVYYSPYQHLFRRTVSNDYHHHADTEAWLSSSLDFISGRRYLSLASPCQDHKNPNYSTSQFPPRENMSDLDDYKQDLDGGNHGEMLYQFREDVLEIYNSSFLHISVQRDSGCPLLLHGGDCISEDEQTHKMLL